MAKYTITLKEICETLSGIENPTYANINDVIDASMDQIFDFDYKVFDNEYKKHLQKLFIKKYYFREICMESFGAWKLMLDVKVNEIMPKYNKLYESEMIKFDPMGDTSYTVKHANNYETSTNNQKVGSNNSENEQSSSGDNKDTRKANNYNLYSDAPTGSTTGIDKMFPAVDGSDDQNASAGGYLTNATKDIVNSSDSTETNGSSGGIANQNYISNDNGFIETVEQKDEVVSGKRWMNSNSKMLMEYRETFINIDKMFLDEFFDMFMLIY